MVRDPRSTFSSSASRYLASTDHRSGPDLEVIRRVAMEVMPLLAVDVATGAGHALRAAAPCSAVCLALDLTREMLSTARGHLAGAGLAHVFYAQCRASELPLQKGAANLVLCRIAAHHFDSIPAFLEEVKRVLSPGGRFVLVDSLAPEDPEGAAFINEVEKFRDPSHRRSLGEAEWRTELDGAGFKVLETTSFSRNHPFREWANRVGMAEGRVLELEHILKEAPEKVRVRFDIRVGENGRVQSYADEKGIWVLGI